MAPVGRSADYFAADAQDRRRSLQFWSLSLEEQFYLLWPLVGLLFIASAPPRAAPPSSPRRRGSSRGCTRAGHRTATAPDRAYFSPLSRAWGLRSAWVLALMLPGGSAAVGAATILGLERAWARSPCATAATGDDRLPGCGRALPRWARWAVIAVGRWPAPRRNAALSAARRPVTSV